jgi:hypothetical protein
LFLLTAIAVKVTAQNSTNYLTVNPYNPITKTYTSTLDMETDQTFAYAYIVQVVAKTTACHVYAKVSSYTGPAGYVPSGYPIVLQFVSNTGNDASNITTGDITLTASDQVLFQEGKHNQQNSYYYNGVLKAPNYALKPGSYTWTVMFTMTQP